MSTAQIDNILARVRSMPPLPDTLLRLLTVLGNPTSTMAEIAEVVRYDQALTTDVLRYCNSAYFGLARTIASLDDAVRVLGTFKVMQLVLAAHTQALLSRPQNGYGLPADALWLHSVAVATCAQSLARRLQVPQVGLLFTVGLLHDVGKVVLNEYVARSYADIAQLVQTRRVSFGDAEREVLGFTHAEIGGRLGEAWALPEPVVRCIRYHHDPDVLTEPDPLVDVTHIADAVCILLGIGGGDDGLSYRACGSTLQRHGLKHADLETIGAEVVIEVKGIRALLAR